MFERSNDKPGAGRLRTALAIAAVTAVVASMAIVGTVAAQTGTQFNDVPRSHWAYEPIQWAVRNGITEGCGDGRNFCPDRTLTRAQTVTFLMRYHEEFGSDTSTGTGTGTGTTETPDEWALRGIGTDRESISSLAEGRYEYEFRLEHTGDLKEFQSIVLDVEGSNGRSEELFNVETSTMENVQTFRRSGSFRVGTRLGELRPGRIRFQVTITDNGSVTGNQVYQAEWEIFVSEW